MAFKNENEVRSLPIGSPYQAGVSDVDPAGGILERGYKMPGNVESAATWSYYDCAIVTYLDSGIAVHRTLPQYDGDPAATLGSYDLLQKDADKITDKGVNFQSVDRFKDIRQRMGHATYIFNLIGRAARVGEQVPIPMLKTVGGVEAIPYDVMPQMAYNKIAGNYSGLVLYWAEWSLWYTVAVPMTKQQDVPPNLGSHADADVVMPAEGIQTPFSVPDDNSLPAAPPQQEPSVSGAPFKVRG